MWFSRPGEESSCYLIVVVRFRVNVSASPHRADIVHAVMLLGVLPVLAFVVVPCGFLLAESEMQCLKLIFVLVGVAADPYPGTDYFDSAAGEVNHPVDHVHELLCRLGSFLLVCLAFMVPVDVLQSREHLGELVVDLLTNLRIAAVVRMVLLQQFVVLCFKFFGGGAVREVFHLVSFLPFGAVAFRLIWSNHTTTASSDAIGRVHKLLAKFLCKLPLLAKGRT